MSHAAAQSKPGNGGIVILLGHENHTNGELSTIAKDRCDRAIELLGLDSDLSVLPTGTFGKNFNTSNEAHGVYLKRYLMEHGIAGERILPHTLSTSTLEDALCARKVVEDSEARRVVVVSSDFHMPRVKYIFKRIFCDREVEFEETPAKGSLMVADTRQRERKEEDSFAYLKDEWVDVPLYKKDESFPAEVYQNASQEHKHYDSISNALVSGMILVFAAPYWKTREFFDGTIQVTTKRALVAGQLFLVAALILICLLLMYNRLAQAARTARRVMRCTELAFGRHGFSNADWRRLDKNRGEQISVFDLINLLGIIFLCFFIISLVYLVALATQNRLTINIVGVVAMGISSALLIWGFYVLLTRKRQEKKCRLIKIFLKVKSLFAN